MAHVNRMIALDAPTFTMMKALVAVGGAGSVTVPVSSFVIEHDKGLVLFDTQLDPRAYDEDPADVYGAGLQSVINLDAKPEQRVDRQLERLGYSPSDVTHVIISHFHFDHVGGAQLFPDAQFIVGQEEIRHAYWPEPVGAGFFRIEELLPMRGFKIWEIDDDLDLFGDGSLIVLSTPGHTPGELSALVKLPHRTILLAGDAAHLSESLENLIPMPFSTNAEKSVRSMRKLQRLRVAHDAFVWATHDPDHLAENGVLVDL